MEIFKREQILKSYLERLTRRTFADLFTAEKKINREQFINGLHSAIENSGEYFDEKTIIEVIENFVRNNIQDENLRNNFLKTIIEVDENGKKRLNNRWRTDLEDYFRKSPEKKGVNIRDQIKDQSEVRAWLYLIIKDENIKNQFRPDFERALSKREPIYFRLWPLEIANYLKHEILEKGIPIGFKEGKFIEGLRSYIKDLQRGKDKVTFWFEKNLLPEELTNKNENELRNLGIEKRGDVYEFYITPDQLSDLIISLVTGYTESIKEQTELTKLFQETKNLLKEVRAKAPSELKQLVGMYGSLLLGLEENYRNMLETGASKEEFDKIAKSAKELKEHLEGIKKDIEAKKPALDIKSKVGQWLKDKGALILGGIGLWALALGWFLPLWLINKMYDQIEKGSLMEGFPFGKK